MKNGPWGGTRLEQKLAGRLVEESKANKKTSME